MTIEEIKQSYFKYTEFMYNADNVGNCSECPENISHSGHECNGHPCGQQNCWVELHCKECKENDKGAAE